MPNDIQTININSARVGGKEEKAAKRSCRVWLHRGQKIARSFKNKKKK